VAALPTFLTAGACPAQPPGYRCVGNADPASHQTCPVGHLMVRRAYAPFRYAS